VSNAKSPTTLRSPCREHCIVPTEAWNAAIAAVHRMVSEAADGHGPLWAEASNGGEVLDRLPNAIWEMRRG